MHEHIKRYGGARPIQVFRHLSKITFEEFATQVEKHAIATKYPDKIGFVMSLIVRVIDFLF